MKHNTLKLKLRLTSVSLSLLAVIVFTVNTTGCHAWNADSRWFTPITSLNQVSGGDFYNITQPAVSNSTLFNGLRVALTVAHGVEDIEMTYVYQYFFDRGASIDILCAPGQTPSGYAILLDYTKPTYILTCSAFWGQAGIDLANYDVVYVPGGQMSSTTSRHSDALTSALWSFYNSDAKDKKVKVLAIICSGSEVMLDSGISGFNDHVVGSPASQDILELWGARYHDVKVLVRYQGQSQGKGVTLVMGQNPMASFEFVQAIGKVLSGVEEGLGPYPAPTPIASVFAAVKQDMSNVGYAYPDTSKIPTPVPAVGSNTTQLKGMEIVIIGSPGMNDIEANYLAVYFADRGAKVKFQCPWGSEIQALNGARPTYHVLCTQYSTATAASATTVDAYLIVGGPWCTGVLRNQANLGELIARATNSVIGVLDTGVQTLIHAGNRVHGVDVAATYLVGDDLNHAGLNWMQSASVMVSCQPQPASYTYTYTYSCIVSGRDINSLAEFTEQVSHVLMKRQQQKKKKKGSWFGQNPLLIAVLALSVFIALLLCVSIAAFIIKRHEKHSKANMGMEPLLSN